MNGNWVPNIRFFFVGNSSVMDNTGNSISLSSLYPMIYLTRSFEICVGRSVKFKIFSHFLITKECEFITFDFMI